MHENTPWNTPETEVSFGQIFKQRVFKKSESELLLISPKDKVETDTMKLVI